LDESGDLYKEVTGLGKTAIGLIGIAFAIGVALAIGAWYGLAFSVIWGWFAVPLGAPGIGVVQAMGLSLLYGCLSLKKKSVDIDWFSSLIHPAIALFVGWILTFFMR
jgi:hypothetical protein